MKESLEQKTESNGRSEELAALLAAAHAILENRAFDDAATAVLRACRTNIGADAGLVAVRPIGEKDFEVATLDRGDLELDSSAGLPAPLLRLSDGVLEGSGVIANDLSKDGATRTAAGDGSFLNNALLAPIIIDDNVAGLVCLLNKQGGFSAGDSRLAAVFAEMAAVAMLNKRTVNGLEKDRNALETELRESAGHLHEAEEKFRTLVENLPDIVARFDADLRHLYVNPSFKRVTGRRSPDLIGRTNRELGMPDELAELWDGALRRAFESGQPETLEFSFSGPEGVRYFDCRLVPEPGPGGTISSVLSVAREVTDRWLAYEAERSARTIANELREATVALTRSLDRETVLVTLLDHLRRIVPFDRASVMLLEEAARVSVRAIFDGDRVLPVPSQERPEFLSSEHAIVHGILTTGKAVLIPDVDAHADWSFPTDQLPAASWIGVPLFARGEVAGLFSLSKREPGYFNEEHLRLAEAMSSQASVAVENAVLFEQMQASTLRMQSLSRRLVEVQESERRNIARELHDEAGQALVSLRHGLRLLERKVDKGGSVTEEVEELVQRTDALIESLHRLASDLRPPSLDHLGLEAALRQYTRSAGSDFNLEVRYKSRGFTNDRLPMVVATALYRVVQEAITNVVRHARATRVDVLAERRDDRVLVMVEDNGVGFDPSQVQRGDHFGLLGMKERAEALSGTLTIESRPGAGTTIVMEVASADPHPDR